MSDPLTRDAREHESNAFIAGYKPNPLTAAALDLLTTRYALDPRNIARIRVDADVRDMLMISVDLYVTAADIEHVTPLPAGDRHDTMVRVPIAHAGDVCEHGYRTYVAGDTVWHTATGGRCIIGGQETL